MRDPRSAAWCLEGMELDNGWRVEALAYRPPKATGGHFSVGYRVTNKDGRTGYLKALDFSAAMHESDPARIVQAMTTAFNFERDLLSRCSDNRLTRVVKALADGKVTVAGFGHYGVVQYLIFEMADHDIRIETIAWQRFDLAWALRCLHHVATGLRQLHSIGIAHQDLKPSNVMVIPGEGSKVGDLGRASLSGRSSPFDNAMIPGDRGYAPPEQWYRYKPFPDHRARFIADLYLLGSLVFFFFTGLSATQAIWTNISRSHSKNFTNTDFQQDLPYLCHAFSLSLDDLRKAAEVHAANYAQELVVIAVELCEPDPARRGVLRPAGSLVPQYDLQSYISRFDRLAWRAERQMQ